MIKRVVNMSLLPGENLDGTGRVCIHLFVQDEQGLIVEPHALHPHVEDGEIVKQKVDARPTRGRLACDPKRSVKPVMRSGVIHVTSRTDDPRAVTCPKCLASQDYLEMMAVLEQVTASR